MSQSDLNSFYENNIYSLIKSKSNYEQIKLNLATIASEPHIVKTSFYGNIWEECCKLFKIGIELAINERLVPEHKQYLIHQCVSGHKCQKCLNEDHYINKCGKIETIEEDILQTYNKFQRKMNYGYTSSSEDDKKKMFFNYDLFTNIKKKKSDYTNRKAVTSIDDENDLDLGIEDIDALPFEANNDAIDILSDENNYVQNNSSNNLNNSFELKFYCGNNDNSNYTLDNMNTFKDITVKNDNLFSKMIENSNSINITNNNNNIELNNNNTIITQNNQNEMDFMSHSPTYDTVDMNKQGKVSISLSHRSNSIKKMKLKEFQFKFTKRENIDKKIMRKFRKYLKEKYKKHNNTQVISLINSQKFWIDFIKQNLLPPFVYDYEEKEFKSFNTGYMLWIFGHANAFELYNHFISANQQTLNEHFQTLYHLEDTDDEFTLLKTYISTLAKVFGCNNNSTESNSNENFNLMLDNNNINSFIKANEEMLLEDFEEHIFSSPPSKQRSKKVKTNSNNFIINDKLPRKHNNLQFISQEPKKDYNGYISLHPTMPDIFNEIIQSNNKNNAPFHSKSLVCSTKELNDTITDESDEYYENKEEFNSDSDF